MINIIIIFLLISVDALKISGFILEKCSYHVLQNGINVTQTSIYNYDPEALSFRKTPYPIHPMILARRSLKEMTGEPITDAEMFNLLEALRWGPSNFNSQPWRIVYAKHNTTRFNQFVELLDPGNQKWAKDASVLMVLVVDLYNRYKGTNTFMHSNVFAAGTAYMALALEASARGYVVHSMGGFDIEKTNIALKIDKNPEFAVQVIIAIGKRLPLNQRNTKFSEKKTDRRPITDLVNENVWRDSWN